MENTLPYIPSISVRNKWWGAHVLTGMLNRLNSISHFQGQIPVPPPVPSLNIPFRQPKTSGNILLEISP